uniref:Uncharacterized protein n=1 Tax=Anguilla anguilla TaxID=7936 RepID=A0A0E9TWH2_ANGAN
MKFLMLLTELCQVTKLLIKPQKLKHSKTNHKSPDLDNWSFLVLFIYLFIYLFLSSMLTKPVS